MDLLRLKSDLESGTVIGHLEFIDDNVKRIKSGTSVDLEAVQSVVTAWSMILESSKLLSDPTLLRKCILFLRVACVQGSSTQTFILGDRNMIRNIRESLVHLDDTVVRSTWQLCSNLLVQCPDNVDMALRELLPLCLTSLDTAVREMDTIAAVIHNLLEANKLLNSPIEIDKSEIHRAALGVIYKYPDEQFIYLQFLLEDLLIHELHPKDSYHALAAPDRIKLHRYVCEYVKSGENELSSAFLRVLSNNFNGLSDGILTWLNGKLDSVDPQELLSLLECLCTITGHQKYSLAFKSEASMFINSGALLVACCDSQNSEVAPKAKLTDFETAQGETNEDPFFDFKTLLIRLIGNLAYKNKKNQDYARDLKILLTICGCTTLDARNPLMKEWSILAIRNLLDNNLENQKLIHQLTQQGRVANDVVQEFQPEKGFMRLNK